MKKSVRILIALLALSAIVLFLWGNRISDGLKAVLPHMLQREAIGDTAGKAPGALNDESSHELDDGLNKARPDGQAGSHTGEKASDNRADYLINEEGASVLERILVPEGFERVSIEENSFGEYLRNLPLKPHGAKVIYYDGRTKPLDVHAAVLDLDVGERDLQQCADSIIRLRAEYLYGKGLYDRIHFNFTNGFNADYSKWMDGHRIKVSGNNVQWVKQGTPGFDYISFRKYLDMVFAYSGTLSLSKEMKNITVEEMQPGDVFLKGALPGHCVIVLDMAENKKTQEVIFITAQGYMPAQEMHILKNPANEEGNPWYSLDFGDELITPEWTFTNDQLYRFEE